MIEFLKNYEYYENIDLVHLNTYKVHSNCEYLVYPRKINELISLLKYLRENKIEYIILGSGSNVILSKNNYKVVIKLDKLNIILINGNVVEAECGVKLSKLITTLEARGLSGLECLLGIPGEVGASTRGNVSCFNVSISDYIKEVKVLDENYNIITLSKDKLNFKYRSSYIKENPNLIVISTTFVLNMTSPDIIKENIIKCRKERVNKQPLNYPNAGSVFKNPLDNYAGKLIESLSLRGYNINDAMISKRHGNFIINKGNASGNDIINLIDYIKRKVYDKYNIDLELEQEIL